MLNAVSRRLSTLEQGTREVLADDRSSVLGAVAAGWFLSLGVRMAYPVLLPYIRTDYGLDFSTAGLLLTVLWGAYAVGQLPGGLFTDRLGERWILAVSTLLSAAMLLLLLGAGSTTVVYLATGLFGLCTALYGVARFTAISKLYSDNDGAAIGVTLAAGDAGNALLPAVAGAIAATFAWQLGFGLAVPLFVLVAGYLWLVVPSQSSNTSGEMAVSLDTARYVLGVLTHPSIVVVTCVLILGFSIWQAFTGFYPSYLIEVKGLSTAVSTGLFSLFFGFGIVVHPLSGAVYDRYGIRTTFPLFFGPAVVGLVLLPVVERLWAIALLTIVLSTLLGNIAITTPYLTAALPTDIQGTGLGVIRTGYMLIGSTSPVLFGTLADRGFFDEGFYLLAALASVMILLVTVFLPDETQV